MEIRQKKFLLTFNNHKIKIKYRSEFQRLRPQNRMEKDNTYQ